MSTPKLPFKPQLHVASQGQLSDSISPSSIAPLRFANDKDGEWIHVVSCDVAFSVHEFSQVIDALVHHPERNSPLILRAEVEQDVDLTLPTHNALSTTSPAISQYHPARLIRRLLCPRQPKRDRPLHQSCLFYVRDRGPGESVVLGDQIPTILVLSPDLSEDHPTPPFYHPAVAHLAIRYVLKDTPGESGAIGSVVIDVVRLAADVPSESRGTLSTEAKSNGVGTHANVFPPRLVKTCVSLLEGVCRVGYGFANGYRKRVDHDILVDKAEFQDLYIKMKEMHGGLVETWQEATDPSKHVFEDIGIATFLMLLWKKMYQDSGTPNQPTDNVFPWSHYARPPGGFRDIGCGNGLLTHILVVSGYDGVGIDLRPRKSWSNYAAKTEACLKVEALDFTDIQYDYASKAFTGLPQVLASNAESDCGKTFFIGNHADELTPWMPLIAHAANADFISIPCCFWALDERFHARKSKELPGPSSSARPRPDVPWELLLADRLHSVIGGTADANAGTKKGGKEPSQYGRYMLWLARLQRSSGFEVEVEALRIPSTRNWAFIGRNQTWKTKDEQARVDQYVDGLVNQIRERGLFKTRIPEGKEGGFVTLYGH